jgi:hypothetical protein
MASDDPRILELDITFQCPTGSYAIGDTASADPDALPSPVSPGLHGYQGALGVGLASPGEVTLHVRSISQDQLFEEPMEISTDSAVASNRTGVFAQGPMHVVTEGEPVAQVGGAAERRYWAKWFCLARTANGEEHLLGLYLEPEPGDEHDPDDEVEPLPQIAALFEAEGTPLLRTDFTNDEDWATVVAAVSKPADFGGGYGDYEPAVAPIDDQTFEGATGATLAEISTRDELPGGYVLLADARTMAEAAAGTEPTVEYVDLSVTDDEAAELFKSHLGRTFRCTASEVAGIEANLSISNMDFSDYADAVSSDGVFRGFDDE